MYKTLLDLENSFFKLKYISDRKWLDRILHNDFCECGKSGVLFNKRYYRTSVWVNEGNLKLLFHQATELRNKL